MKFLLGVENDICLNIATEIIFVDDMTIEVEVTSMMVEEVIICMSLLCKCKNVQGGCDGRWW